MREWLRVIFRDRPWWMNVMMVFCAYMTFLYVPWDLFIKPVADDKEVWFGILFSGWAAKLAALPHWFVYGAGLYGFRRMRPWMCNWGTFYIAQVAVGMLVWNVLQLGGLLGWFAGAVAATPFSALALLFWNSRDRFCGERENLRGRYGEWALVTGASAGIGAAFARALAAEGVSIVLTARREDRLRELADELAGQHGIETRVVAADLSQPGACEAVVAAVADLEIGMLINNAGFGYAGRFDKLDAQRLREQIEVNCMAPTLLTRALLPGMRERRRGAVLFTGSVAGRQPLPLHGVYAATKAFDLFLGESLWVEGRGDGVDVLVLEPGSTETEFQEVAGEIAHDGETPETVVRVALDALGHQPSVIVGWLDWARSNLATRLGPRDFVASVAHHIIERQTPEDMR